MIPVSDQWESGVRSGFTPSVRAEVWRDGAFVAALPVTGGDVSCSESSKVRCQVGLTVPLVVSTAALHELLSVDDTDVRVWAGMERGDGSREEVPVIWGRVSGVERAGVYAPVQVHVSDYALVMQQARFITPWVTVAGRRVVDEIAAMIHDVDPSISMVDGTGMVPAPVTRPGTWEKDRWDAIKSLAAGIGCEIFFTPERVAMIRPVPEVTASTSPVWTVDSGERGVLTDVAVGADAPGYNAVVASSEPSQESPVSAVAYAPSWRAGVKRPRFFVSSFLTTVEQCMQAAQGILVRSQRFARSVKPESVPNYSLQVGDPVRVTLTDDLDETRIVTAIRYPLGPVGAMTMDTRVSVDVETAMSITGDLS